MRSIRFLRRLRLISKGESKMAVAIYTIAITIIKAIIFFLVLYAVIRAAIKDGILAAKEEIWAYILEELRKNKFLFDKDKEKDE